MKSFILLLLVWWFLAAVGGGRVRPVGPFEDQTQCEHFRQTSFKVMHTSACWDDGEK